MAYNVLKGNVEGSVDQHGDQEIDGVKVFKNTVSAATFYDTDAQSPCATENNVALKQLDGEVPGGIIVYDANKVAHTSRYLRFDDDEIFRTHHAVIGTLTGSGAGLTDLRASKLIGTTKAANINYGAGLEDHRGELRIKVGAGICADLDGVAVATLAHGALDHIKGQLSIDHKNSANVTQQGQNISDDDLILLHDTSRHEIRHSSFKNLYDNYISFKVPQAQGPKYSLQFKGVRTFEGTSELTYDPRRHLLSVAGTLSAQKVKISQAIETAGRLDINGALYQSIKHVSELSYHVQDTDNTLLLDASANQVVVILPRAHDSVGRVLTIKRICGDENKHELVPSHSVVIKTDGVLIDFTSQLVIKSNYSARTLQSDGQKWWSINRSGS